MLPPARAAVFSSAPSRALPPESLPLWARRYCQSRELLVPSCWGVDLRRGARSLRVCRFTSYPRARILWRGNALFPPYRNIAQLAINAADTYVAKTEAAAAELAVYFPSDNAQMHVKTLPSSLQLSVGWEVWLRCSN